MRVTFLGMTHLGINSAAVAAKKGWTVSCFDFNQQRLRKISNAQTEYSEPYLKDYLQRYAQKIRILEVVSEENMGDLIYISADVPTDEFGNSDISEIEEYLELVIRSAGRGSAVVVLSQVPPGFTRKWSRKGLKIFYQVETLIFGRAIDRAERPERYIIGLDSPEENLPKPLEVFLRSHGNPPILKMNFESAELAKIAINCCLVASISVANTLAEICENIGADWHDILPALRLDKRIGKYSYLDPGLGLSGGNLERDLNTIIKLGVENRTDVNVIEAFLGNSVRRRKWCHAIFENSSFYGDVNIKISILGLSYKENTNSLKNSPAVELIDWLADYQVSVFDPLIKEFNKNNVTVSPSLKECILGAQVVFIMNKSKAFVELGKKLSQLVGEKALIVDPFGCISGYDKNIDVNYFKLGTESICDGRAEK